MTIESVSFPNDLNATYPAATDARSEGDDHIRNIKTAVKAAFPGLGGRTWRFQQKNAGYTLALTDNMSVIEATTAITLALTAAATLGNGFIAVISASSGAVVVDPDGAETVNGAATITIRSGTVSLLLCDGTDFLLLNLPVTVSGVSNNSIVLGTETATTSGTSHAVTGLPANIKELTIMLAGVSTDGTAGLQITIGDSGGLETTNYSSLCAEVGVGTASTSFGAYITYSSTTAAATYSGSVTFRRESGNVWTWTSIISGGSSVYVGSGKKELSAELDRFSLVTSSGTPAFDAGVMNYSYRA